MVKDLYADYRAWKNWSDEHFFHCDPIEALYFRAEIGESLAGKKVLELGFGNGSFLRWASDQGAQTFGTELDEDAKALARERGVICLDIDLSKGTTDYSDIFRLDCRVRRARAPFCRRDL